MVVGDKMAAFLPPWPVTELAMVDMSARGMGDERTMQLHLTVFNQQHYSFWLIEPLYFILSL